MADGNVPAMRPPGDPDAPEERQINPFKQAINVVMFGSRDPSYSDVGEFRAQHIHKKALYDALTVTAGGSPQVQAAALSAFGQAGAQSAQAMRERYYKKEYKQMVSTQVKPLMGQMEQNLADARTMLQTGMHPIPKVVTPEEGAEIASLEEMRQGPRKEVLQTGKTADGGVKSQVVDQPPDPVPNAAMASASDSLSGHEYLPEQLAYIDPATGQPVPIASKQGIALEQRITGEMLERNKKIQLEMMDVFASYGGNPFAQEAIQNMINQTMQQAGTAVTGRTNSQEQMDWWQERESKQAEIDQMEAETGQIQSTLQAREGEAYASAADAAQLAQGDKKVQELIGKKLWDKIKQGGVEGLTAKEAAKVAGIGSMVREQQVAQVRMLKEAQMIPIPAPRLAKPGTWHSYWNTNDDQYKAFEQERFAGLKEGYVNDVARIRNLPLDERDQKVRDLNAPKAIENLILAGDISQEVMDWIDANIESSDMWKQEKVKAFFDRAEIAVQEDPNFLEAMQDHNEAWIEQRVLTAEAAGETVTQDQIDYLRSDYLGTHIMATTGETPPEYRPARAEMQIKSLLAKKQAARKGAVHAQERARSRIEQTTSEAPVRQAPTAPVEPSQLLRRRITLDTPIEEMTNEELGQQREALRQGIANRRYNSEAERKAWEQRMAFLSEAHVSGPEAIAGKVGSFLKDVFTTSDEERAEMYDRRQKQRQAILELGRPVN